MNEQLERAYQLIKNGQKQEAIDILEPIIRIERDNDDAWWLLANATSDASAKRNALNNVLRLSTNSTRQAKAQAMLQELNFDPFDFDVETSSKPSMSAYQALDEVPQKQASGFSCATISLLLVGMIGLCACAGIFGIASSAGDVFRAVSYPESYNEMGVLENNLQVTGVLSEESPQDGYLYSGDAGDSILINLEHESLTSPMLVIFEEDTEVPLAYSMPEDAGSISFSYELSQAGDYLVTISGYKLLGQDLAYGEYHMEVEIE